MKINNTIFKKTKIVSTAGPTFETEEQMRQMFKRGVNVVRLNTSHGDFEEHGKRIENIKKIRKELKLPISILLDTKGPEIRIHEIENGKFKVKIGDVLKIYCNKKILGKNNEFSVTYSDLTKTVKPKQLIMVDDGKLALEVKDVDLKQGFVLAVSKNNHYIGTKKAINLPGVDLTLPFISKHDEEFIKWGIKQGIDYVAASFVRNVDDLIKLKKLLVDNGGENVLIMSKIESLNAINNLNKIIKYSDSIMLARGDLGVEIPYYQVPFYEKLIINKCRAWGKPIVIATQMLDSMINNPRPTRAEVTDIYYASISGTDATMLSGESASGNFPNEAVETMSRINVEAETNFNYLDSFEQAYAYVESSNAESAYLVAKAALIEDAKYIFSFSEQGRLVKALSRFRPNALIVALIKDANKTTKFGVDYGVYAKSYKDQKDFFNDEKIVKIAKEIGIKKGNKVIVSNKSEYRTIRV